MPVAHFSPLFASAINLEWPPYKFSCDALACAFSCSRDGKQRKSLVCWEKGTRERGGTRVDRTRSERRYVLALIVVVDSARVAECVVHDERWNEV